jgi:hypothetical protein
MSNDQEAPRVFISYSWTTPQYKKRVIELATRLTTDGVHVVLDEWDLKPGHDKYVFMERMVTDATIKKVLVVLNTEYATKADRREGGVGAESLIITPELYKQVDQEKFIPIIFDRRADGEVPAPAYLAGRIYIDLSSTAAFAVKYEELLRNIYDKPALPRPTLGAPPPFLTEANPLPPALHFGAEEVARAFGNSLPGSQGHLRRFLTECVQALDVFEVRTIPNENIDEIVLSKLQELLPLRNEVLNVVDIVCTFATDLAPYKELHRFFEQAAALMFRPANLGGWREEWFDHHRFFLRELRGGEQDGRPRERLDSRLPKS